MRLRFTIVTVSAVCMLAATASGDSPYERTDWTTPANAVDEHVLAVLAERSLTPANPCSDEVFVRRVYLDVIGTLPQPAEVTAFLEDTRPDKRAMLIDALLARPEFADYWSLKWCDLLRVKAEFPINLWPNAVQAYHRWVHDALARNMPYDEFARQLLTSSGSNFRVAPVNFYRALQGREPATIAAAVALTFMGTRVEHWPADRRRDLEVFFARVAYKTTAEWKEEIVYLDPTPAKTRAAVLPDGTAVRLEAGSDPRRVFADWLIQPGNPWFARAVVNRIWAWLFGRGIIHEPDDLRPDNPPVNAALLACLEQELVQARYDLRHVYRLILNSRTYQQSAKPRTASPDAERLCACYPIRRLDAEVLIDALNQVFGATEGYSSAIPEPFTHIPERERTIALADGSITSPFLELFGRPARDSGLFSERNNQPSDAQRLHLLNSSHIQKKIAESERLRAILRSSGRDRRAAVRTLYLLMLSRAPTAAELSTAEAYFNTPRVKPRQALDDLAWALINTKEFLYRH
ncbi:MAG TPA: DUF1553 domain-containing protein [Phycisphaerae bacterium]|nr:DUF1553 domain-containing protein [Phycisphaerae bacterium]